MSAGPAPELVFVLQVDDGWPPVAKECMPVAEVDAGYQIKVPPLFFKDLSVGDVIAVERNQEGDVVAWKHIERSARSTVWLMVLGTGSVVSAVKGLKGMGCNIVEFEPYRLYAIDVPEDCSMARVDRCLDELGCESVGIAFPSLRHSS